MSTAALPSWLDPRLLQWIIVVVLVVLAYLLYVVLRFVRRLVAKIILVIILGVLGVSLWVQRSDLQDCVRTCECSLFGQEVVIPVDQIPEELRTINPDNTPGCLSTT